VVCACCLQRLQESGYHPLPANCQCKAGRQCMRPSSVPTAVCPWRQCDRKMRRGKSLKTGLIGIDYGLLARCISWHDHLLSKWSEFFARAAMRLM
jgi:hypothetical protein